MSDKTLRALNKGRREAGLKPIRRKKTSTKKGTTKEKKRWQEAHPYEPKKNEDFPDTDKPFHSIVYPKNFRIIGKKDNFAWVEKVGKSYHVFTYRKNSDPQQFKHKSMSKNEAIRYAESFNFLNKC